MKGSGMANLLLVSRRPTWRFERGGAAAAEGPALLLRGRRRRGHRADVCVSDNLLHFHYFCQFFVIFDVHTLGGKVKVEK